MRDVLYASATPVLAVAAIIAAALGFPVAFFALLLAAVVVAVIQFIQAVRTARAICKRCDAIIRRFGGPRR